MVLTTILDLDQLFLVILLIVLSIVYLTSQNVSQFPKGPWGIPFIGNSSILQIHPHIRLSQLKEKYGGVFSLKFGRQRVVVVSSLDGLMEGLVKRSMKLSGRPKKLMRTMFNSRPFQGGICHANPGVHFKIQKDFTIRSLDAVCCSSVVEDVWRAEAEALALILAAQTQPCDLALLIESTMLRLSLYIINGKLYQANDENFHEIWRTFRMNEDTLASRWESFIVCKLWRRSSQLDKFQMQERTNLQYAYQRDIVNRHKDCFNPDIVNDIVDHGLVMLEQNDDMGELTQEQLDGLFVELCGSGYRQLTAALLWIVLYVTYFPHIQYKMYSELISVVGHDRLPRLSDQPHLVYISAVILETQRLASIMPLLYPHSNTDNTQFMGYHIPKDTIFLFNVWSLHHDSKNWKHPMKFDPERFIKDGALDIPEHFLPFGDGLRCCPGEGLANVQLFIFTTILFYHLNISLVNNPDLDGVFKGFVLSPKPFKVKICARETVTMYSDMETSKDVSSDTSLCLSDY